MTDRRSFNLPGFKWDPKTKKFFFSVVIPGTGSRRRRRKWGSAPTRSAALEGWKAFRDRALAGSWEKKKLTLATYWGRYGSVIQGRVSVRTAELEGDIFRLRLIPFFGDVPLTKINLALVRDFVGHLRARKYAPPTINQALSTLRKYLRDAVDRGELENYPIRGRLPREHETPLTLEMSTAERLAFMTSFDDEAGFRQHIEKTRSRGRVASSSRFAGGPRVFGGGRRPDGEAAGFLFQQFNAAKPIFTIALETGLSRGDFLGLRWDAVDFKKGFIRITRGKSKINAVIPISTACSAALKELRARSRFSPYVCLKPTGETYSLTTVCRYHGLAKKIAGITRRLRFNDLRHTFASRLASRGVPSGHRQGDGAHDDPDVGAVRQT